MVANYKELALQEQYLKENILILDEATSSLDQKIEQKVISNIEKDDLFKTILMISHRLSTIKNCNRALS